MATQGRTKYYKYFSVAPIETILDKRIDKINVYNENDEIADILKGGSQITTIPLSEYKPRIKIQYDNKIGYVSISQIEKPKNNFGTTENLKLKTSDLITEGIADTFNGATVKTFNDFEQLRCSIDKNLKLNVSLSNEIINNIGLILNDPFAPILWDATIENNEINELGKNFGEILFLFILLKKKKFLGQEISNIKIPISSNNPEIDSFIILKNETHVAISNKYGQGAAASFFKNFFPYIEENKIIDCALKDLYYCKQKNNLKTIYFYVIKYILKLKLNDEELNLAIDEIFNILCSENLPLSANVEMILNSSKELAYDDYVKFLYPKSITTIYCELIKRKLNNCPTSMAILNEIISDKKNFYHISLNIDQWHIGNIHYNLNKYSDASIKLMKGKSSVADFKAIRGALSYKLKFNDTNKIEF